MLDLFNKLTLDLQRAVLPVYTTVQTLKELMDQCLAINQGLRQIKAYTKWYKTRSSANQNISTIKTGHSALVRSATPIAPTVQPAANLAASRAASPTMGPVNARPIYSNPYIQALSNQGACFFYSQKGYIAKDCLTNIKAGKVLLIQENSTELEKEEPQRKTPLQG